MDRLTLPSGEAAAAELVAARLSHVLEAVTLIRQELKGEVPLIGFSAAPWTLFYYIVGGTSKKNQENGERWLKEHPEASKALLDSLGDIVIEYLSAQVISCLTLTLSLALTLIEYPSAQAISCLTL